MSRTVPLTTRPSQCKQLPLHRLPLGGQMPAGDASPRAASCNLCTQSSEWCRTLGLASKQFIHFNARVEQDATLSINFIYRLFKFCTSSLGHLPFHFECLPSNRPVVTSSFAASCVIKSHHCFQLVSALMSAFFWVSETLHPNRVQEGMNDLCQRHVSS